jgi:chromosomal replication initiation ATPase DnaA
MSDWLRVNRIAIEHGYDPGELRGPRKIQALVSQRRVVAKVLRAAHWSYPRIGRALGGRDHSCVWWLLRGGRRGRVQSTRGGRG